MKPLLLTALLLAVTAACAADGPPGPMQATDSYAAAVRSYSTAPSYVRISVSTDSGWRTTCATANFLLGALTLENGLSHDANGMIEATRLALANTNQHFHFSRREALANLGDLTSDDELALMHRRVDGLSTEELMAGFKLTGGPLRALVDGPNRSLRNAAACVLIERGLSPRQSDLGGQLLVDGR